MVRNPDAVHLDHREPKMYALSPDWLNKLGLEQMAIRQVRAGVVTHLTGLDGGDQMANRELGPMRMAIQLRDLGWAIVKHLRDRMDVQVNWPGLDDIQVAEFSLRAMPAVSYGEPLFDNTFFPRSLDYLEEDAAFLLSLCEREIMEETSEYSFDRAGHLALLADIAGERVTQQTIARTVREWLFVADVPADHQNGRVARSPISQRQYSGTISG
jgi:hypothetical protein